PRTWRFRRPAAPRAGMPPAGARPAIPRECLSSAFAHLFPLPAPNQPRRGGFLDIVRCIARRAFDKRNFLDFALADLDALFGEALARREHVALETADELVVVVDRGFQSPAY